MSTSRTPDTKLPAFTDRRRVRRTTLLVFVSVFTLYLSLAPCGLSGRGYNDEELNSGLSVLALCHQAQSVEGVETEHYGMDHRGQCLERSDVQRAFVQAMASTASDPGALGAGPCLGLGVARGNAPSAANRSACPQHSTVVPVEVLGHSKIRIRPPHRTSPRCWVWAASAVRFRSPRM
jgi:hypothetical protein